ncbi:MAG TPA: GatB/YqeY domain-containing protein [Tepidisphaeraceae bacterium]|nr:GatB/YqeY domain-containing protein [Tepidisphaeraceae bacterium]
MDLVSRLQEDMKAALKAGQKERLGVIRMILSDAKVADLKKITPEEAVAAYARKLSKGIEEMTKYNKIAEADQMKSELAIVQEYLPKKASTDDTAKLVDEFLAKNSFTEKQFGQAMGMFMKAHGGQVDPAAANQLLKQKLAGK